MYPRAGPPRAASVTVVTTNAELRRAIIDAAAELFAEHGYEGVGVRQVAQEAGVSQYRVRKETGGRAVALPEQIFRPLFQRAFRLGLWPYPAGAFDYLKYPVTLSGKRFTEATDFRPLFGLEEIFHSVRR